MRASSPFLVPLCGMRGGGGGMTHAARGSESELGQVVPEGAETTARFGSLASMRESVVRAWENLGRFREASLHEEDDVGTCIIFGRRLSLTQNLRRMRDIVGGSCVFIFLPELCAPSSRIFNLRGCEGSMKGYR